MRILHVFDHSIPLHSGYTFRSRSILRHQRALGWETAHLTSPRHTLNGPSKETVDGLEFHRTPAPAKWLDAIPGLGEIALIRATTRRLADIIPDIKPDILHAHSPVLNAIPALRAGRRFGLPVVYEVRAFWEDAAVSHGNGSEGGPRYAATRWLESYALKRADAVTTICEGLRGDIIARGIPAERVTVIPNAVDTDVFSGGGDADQALASELGLDGKTVIGFIGSFYGYEGLHLLIEAMPRIWAAAPETCLLLVGGGPEDARLRSQADALGQDGRIVFTGRVPHDQVQRYYDLVDLFVYPRVNIRLTDLVTPLKPLEAMAQEKIVVASDIGGHRELIRDGDTGTLFRADDPNDLAATALKVMNARGGWPAQRERARRYVETERNWAASVDRYKAVYQRLTR